MREQSCGLWTTDEEVLLGDVQNGNRSYLNRWKMRMGMKPQRVMSRTENFINRRSHRKKRWPGKFKIGTLIVIVVPWTITEPCRTLNIFEFSLSEEGAL